jgi:hypothetical protein
MGIRPQGHILVRGAKKGAEMHQNSESIQGIVSKYRGFAPALLSAKKKIFKSQNMK